MLAALNDETQLEERIDAIASYVGDFASDDLDAALVDSANDVLDAMRTHIDGAAGLGEVRSALGRMGDLCR